MIRVELFYSPRCPHCRRARSVVGEVRRQLKRRFKKGLVQEKMKLELVNILEPKGRMRAAKYGIRGVPTIVVNGTKTIVGVPRKKDLKESIEAAKGER